MEATKETADQTQYLTFYLADEEYAVSILRVREIIEYDVITKIPKMPPSIRGVINLRGSVVPVVDLAVKFSMPECVVGRRTCIIIVEVDLEGERTVMGIIADTVSQVMDLLPQDIEAPPAFGTRLKVDYLQGMGKVGKKFILILNIDRVLSPHELLTAASLKTLTTPAGTPTGAEEAPPPSGVQGDKNEKEARN